MRRRLLKNLKNYGISPSDAIVGDICLYDKVNDGLVLVKEDEWSIETYPASNYEPVGIVVVPGTHDVYGNGSCAIISLKCMDTTYPTTGGIYGRQQQLCWGPSTEMETLPTGFLYIAVLGMWDSIGNNDDGSIVELQTNGIIPTDHQVGVQSPYDTNRYYSISSGDYLVPSPYLSNGNRNPKYYQTSSPSSSANCLADFDGIGNTNTIIAKRGDIDYSGQDDIGDIINYPAASCCDVYSTNGTQQGDWYLPAIGELGYFIANKYLITEVNSKLKSAYGQSFVNDVDESSWWSSTQCDRNAWSISIFEMYGHQKNIGSHYARAFLRINNS